MVGKIVELSLISFLDTAGLNRMVFCWLSQCLLLKEALWRLFFFAVDCVFLLLVVVGGFL